MLWQLEKVGEGGLSEPVSTNNLLSTRNQRGATTALSLSHQNPCCPADRPLMTNEIYPWQPVLKHYFGCQPSHHAVILQRGVTHRSQCLLWRLMWLEVLSRTSIFVLFLLHSWTAGSVLWQPPRKAQHGLRAREQRTKEVLRGLLWCPDHVVKILEFLLVVYNRSNRSRRHSKRTKTYVYFINMHICILDTLSLGFFRHLALGLSVTLLFQFNVMVLLWKHLLWNL